MKMGIFLAVVFVLTVQATDNCNKVEQLIHQHQYTKAENVLSECKSTEQQYYYRSLISFLRGDFDQAIAIARDGLKVAKNKSRFYEWLGDIYSVKAQKSNFFSAIGFVGKIKENWKKAVALDSTNVTVREKLYMFYLMAPGLAGGDPDQALKLAKEVEQRNPMLAGLLKTRYFLKNKQTAKTEEIFNSLLKDYPDSVRVLQEAAWYYARQNEFARSRDLLKRAIKLRPEESDLYVALGRLYFKNEMPDSALSVLQQATKVDSFDYRARLLQAQALKQLGQTARARKIVEDILQHEVMFDLQEKAQKFLKEL